MARRSEQIESVAVNHDFPHDPDLITHWEPFDGPCQHPIRETAPPMNTDELFCIGHIDTNQLIQLESCKPTPEHLISIPSSASHIVTPLLPHRLEGLLRQHPVQALAAYVVSGLSIGYQYSSSRRSSLSANILSAARNPRPVEQYLATELAAGRSPPSAGEQIWGDT